MRNFVFLNVVVLASSTLPSCYSLPVNESFQPFRSLHAGEQHQLPSALLYSSISHVPAGASSPSAMITQESINLPLQETTTSSIGSHSGVVFNAIREPKLTFKAFKEELNSIGLTSKSTSEQILKQTKGLMNKYQGNPAASKHFYKYLAELIPDKTIVALVRATRNNIAAAKYQKERRGQIKTNTRYVRKYRSNSNKKQPLTEGRIRAIQHRNEVLKHSRMVNLDQFDEKLKKAGLHYGLDPYTYAVKEYGLKGEMNSNSYGSLQRELRKRFKVDPAWLALNAKASSSISNQRFHFAKENGDIPFTVNMIKRPQWAMEGSDSESTSTGTPPAKKQRQEGVVNVDAAGPVSLIGALSPSTMSAGGQTTVTTEYSARPVTELPQSIDKGKRVMEGI